MKKIYFIGYVVTLLVLGFGFLLSCDKKDPLVVTGNIAGFVTDADTGQPLQGVNVSSSPGGLTTVTGSDGRYEFSDIAAGLYSIQFMKHGYTTNTKQITVVAGKTAFGDCTLSQGAVVMKSAVGFCDYNQYFDIQILKAVIN